MDTILLSLCSALSCFIIISIFFQFMNERYQRNFKSQYLYIVIKVALIIFFTTINMLSNAILNLLSWIIMVGVCAFFLYFEDSGKPIRRILECEALVLCLSVCESLGVILIQWILQIIHINVVDEVMLHCLEVAFSKIILIFLYYIAFSRLMRKKNIPPSKTQYSVYTIVFVYSFINMLLIAESFMEGKTSYLWAVNMGCIVLADLYLLYFIKMANEKSFYENEVKILEQQASLQYEYYLTQTEKYNATIQIFFSIS